MLRSSLLALALIMSAVMPAAAQTLQGSDTAPGDSCTDKPEGATRMVADADGDGGRVTLVCNGTTWEPEAPLISGSCSDGDSVVFDSASGGFRCEAGGSLALTDLTDVVITSPDDGVALVYESSTGNWVNKTCDDSADTVFNDLENQSYSTQVSSAIQPLSGTTCESVNVSISGDGSPQYRVCDDASCSSVSSDWSFGINPISSGQYIQVRLTTSANADTTFTATVNIGSASTDWNVKTTGPKTVFVTSSTHDGDLGGLQGADNICQNLADSEGLSGTFKAWLSDSSTSVASRFTQANQQYLRVDGVKVADNWSDLTDGTIDNPIEVNEQGNTLSTFAEDRVWTGTDPDGSIYSSFHDFCDDTWVSNSSSFDGLRGISSDVDDGWTNSGNTGCDAQYRLYCFEQ